jgi:multiple antibiotic resistance protein
LTDVFQFGATSFVALFFVVDPFAIVPVTLAMTHGYTPEQRRRTARRAAITVGLVLGGFAFAGGLLFRAFGIDMATFRIAGGILLFLMALDMLRAHRSATRTSEEEVREGTDKTEVGAVPLGMPMLAGPGAMSTVAVLVQGARGSWMKLVAVGLCVVATALLCYVVLAGAERLRALLKTTGLNVLNRIMGLILAAVAVQFVATGVKELFPALAPEVTISK